MRINIKPILVYLRRLVSLQDHIDTAAASASIRQSIHFRGPNVFILGFAIIVASVGLNVNSIPVIIGAMLISPLMGPIMGFGLGLGVNDTDLVKSALKNLAVMVSISILASTLYFLLTPLSLAHPTELLARTKPTIYDVFIALFGGFAGIFESSRKERGTVMSGVSIATALMPPLCTVGFGLATLQWRFAIGALYLFMLNSILIALATYLTVKYLKYPAVEPTHTWTRKRVISIVIVLLVLIVPSVITAVTVVRENQFESRANDFIDQHKMLGSSYIYQTEVDAGAQRIDFYLAGDALSESDRTMFMARAIEAGFDSTMIVLHADATQADNTGLMEQALVKDLFLSKDEQLQAQQQEIASLRQQLAAAEEHHNLSVSAEQLGREVNSQIERVHSLWLTEGDSYAVGDTVPQHVTIVRVGADGVLTHGEQEQLERWLRVRLNRENILLIAE